MRRCLADSKHPSPALATARARAGWPAGLKGLGHWARPFANRSARPVIGHGTLSFAGRKGKPAFAG